MLQTPPAVEALFRADQARYLALRPASLRRAPCAPSPLSARAAPLTGLVPLSELDEIPSPSNAESAWRFQPYSQPSSPEIEVFELGWSTPLAGAGPVDLGSSVPTAHAQPAETWRHSAQSHAGTLWPAAEPGLARDCPPAPAALSSPAAAASANAALSLAAQFYDSSSSDPASDAGSDAETDLTTFGFEEGSEFESEFEELDPAEAFSDSGSSLCLDWDEGLSSDADVDADAHADAEDSDEGEDGDEQPPSPGKQQRELAFLGAVLPALTDWPRFPARCLAADAHDAFSACRESALPPREFVARAVLRTPLLGR